LAEQGARRFVKTWLAKSIGWAAPVWVAAALCLGAARAADVYLPTGPAPLPDSGNFFEARFGVFAHGIGSVEEGTVDLNGSVVTPRLVPGVTGAFGFVVPRVHFGGAVNLSDRTSFGYTGLLWTIPVWDRLFAEAYVGPAVHNGSFIATPTLAGLGCPVLFHSGASVGYRFSERWSVMGTFEHLSNGKTLFGVNCGTNQAPVGSNQGLNNYGVRVGYSF
jgi:lipid A 3-O-deacylase